MPQLPRSLLAYVIPWLVFPPCNALSLTQSINPANGDGLITLEEAIGQSDGTKLLPLENPIVGTGRVGDRPCKADAMETWSFDVVIWQHLPVCVADDILKLVLGVVPTDPTVVPTAPVEWPRRFVNLPNGILVAVSIS